MSVIASLRSQLVPIHREGYPFIGFFALVSLILFFLFPPLGWIATVRPAGTSKLSPLRIGRAES